MKKIYLIPLVLLGALGIWMGIKMMNKEPKDPTVMVCDSADAETYHTHKCSGLQHCEAKILKMKKSEAQKKKRHRCEICYK